MLCDLHRREIVRQNPNLGMSTSLLLWVFQEGVLGTGCTTRVQSTSQEQHMAIGIPLWSLYDYLSLWGGEHMYAFCMCMHACM